jgi:hypothetical protein
MPVNLSIKNVPDEIAVDHLKVMDLAAQARLTACDAS